MYGSGFRSCYSAREMKSMETKATTFHFLQGVFTYFNLSKLVECFSTYDTMSVNALTAKATYAYVELCIQESSSNATDVSVMW